MQGRLAQTYKVSREIAQRGEFRGDITLKQMPRLSSLVLSGDQSIAVSFEFGQNSFGLALVKGYIETELMVECQRCLEPMALPVNHDFELLIDASDQDIEQYQLDTVYSEEGYLDMFAVIEDEMILTMPLISMHEDMGCNGFMPVATEVEQAVEKNNPFEALKALKETD